MPSADWYFDFVSPFSYLQCEQLPMLERSVRIRYRPVLFAGLLKAHGHKGPAEIASKRRFTYRFVVWQAAKLGIPLKFPAAHPFNPLPLLRLAIAADCEPSAVRTRVTRCSSQATGTVTTNVTTNTIPIVSRHWSRSVAR